LLNEQKAEMRDAVGDAEEKAAAAVAEKLAKEMQEL